MNYSDKSMAPLRKVVARQVFDRKQGTVSAEFRCPVDFPPFGGHFPGQPVLPAVIQLAFVRMLAADLLRTELDVVETGRVKFKGMIGPDETVQVRVVLKKRAEQWHAAFKLKKQGSAVASGSMVYRARG